MITLPRPTRQVVHQPTREVVPRHLTALHTAKRSLDGPNPWSSRLTKNLHRC